MRKRIALFMGELCREFQSDFARCIREFASLRGYDVFLFANFGAYTSTSMYDSGERDVVYIPDFSRFDGVINLADTFDINGMEELLLKQIREHSDCPIVSVRNGDPSTYLVKFNDYDTAYNMAKHFTDDHGFTRICYMAGPADAPDAVIRKNAFMDAMRDAGITIPQNAIFYGDYWNFLSVPATEQFLTAYGDELPQVIICANDYMALGIADELKKRGIKIPDNICISGCDDIIEGNGYRPSLTTVRMPVSRMATSALDIIDRVNQGLPQEKIIQVTGENLLKRSCGCCEDIYSYDPAPMINQIREDFVSIRQASLICTDILNCINEEDKLHMIDSYFYRTLLKKAHLCLCSHHDDEGDDAPAYTEKMRYRCAFPLKDEINEMPLINQEFDKSDIIPPELYGDEPQFFMIFPLHNKSNTYGYLVCEDGGNYISPFISGITSALAAGYEDLRILEQFAEFLEIKQQNLHDPLTGLYNRRGFDQQVSSFMASNQASQVPISFISVDMDSLKYINDNYGHPEGDEAIKIFADLLKDMVGPNDVVARVGGDEFQILLTSPDVKEHENFISKAMVTIAIKNDLIEKPYDIHGSFGAYYTHSSKSTSSFDCLQIADKRMYEQKRLYKASIKSPKRY